MKPFRRTATQCASVSWAAELVELAAVFLAVGMAHLFVSLVGHHADGGALLVISGVALSGGAILHRWWGARVSRRTASNDARSPSALHDLLAIPVTQRGLWRIRAALSDRPGNLAALSAKLAALDVNILAVQVHPSADNGVTDEFLVAANPGTTAKEIVAAVEAGGGSQVHVVVTDAHDLADPPTRALMLAAQVAAGDTSLSHALAELLPGSNVDAQPAAPASHPSVPLCDPSGRLLRLTRLGLPFTPTEVARAQALVDLCARLGTDDAAWGGGPARRPPQQGPATSSQTRTQPGDGRTSPR